MKSKSHLNFSKNLYTHIAKLAITLHIVMLKRLQKIFGILF